MSPRKKVSIENAFEAELLRIYNRKNNSVPIKKREPTKLVVDEFEKKVMELVKLEHERDPRTIEEKERDLLGWYIIRSHTKVLL